MRSAQSATSCVSLVISGARSDLIPVVKSNVWVALRSHKSTALITVLISNSNMGNHEKQVSVAMRQELMIYSGTKVFASKDAWAAAHVWEDIMQ